MEVETWQLSELVHLDVKYINIINDGIIYSLR